MYISRDGYGQHNGRVAKTDWQNSGFHWVKGRPESMSGSEPRSVKSAERVLDLLEFIGAGEDGVTFVQIGKELGIPKSSLHALLDVLHGREYVQLDEDTRKYSLGVKVWEAGRAYQRRHGMIELARPVLRAIVARVNETVQLAELAGRDNVYLDKADSTHPLRLQSQVGTRLPAYATGVGKALLAQLSNEEVRTRFGTGGLPVHSPTTLPTVDALIEELEITRERGFAIDNEEYSAGVFCVAVPVHEAAGPAGTAISVSVPVTRATEAGLSEMLAELARGSLEISATAGRRRADPNLEALTEVDFAARAIAGLVASGRYDLRFLKPPEAG